MIRVVNATSLRECTRWICGCDEKATCSTIHKPQNMINNTGSYVSAAIRLRLYDAPPAILVTLIPTAANAGPTFKSTLTVLLLIACS
jgi:hypothetical protein